MRLSLFVLVALVVACTLAPMSAKAGEFKGRKVMTRVEYRIHVGGRVTSPLLPLPRGTQLQIFDLLGSRWGEDIRPKLVGWPDSTGLISARDSFPITESTIDRALSMAKGKKFLDAPIGVIVLEANGDRMRLEPGTHLCIEVVTLGALPSPAGESATIVGEPDDDGYIRSTMRLPINATTLANLQWLKQGRGQ